MTHEPGKNSAIATESPLMTDSHDWAANATPNNRLQRTALRAAAEPGLEGVLRHAAQAPVGRLRNTCLYARLPAARPSW